MGQGGGFGGGMAASAVVLLRAVLLSSNYCKSINKKIRKEMSGFFLFVQLKLKRDWNLLVQVFGHLVYARTLSTDRQ